MIRIEGVEASFDGGRTRVLRGFDLVVQRGEVLALVGESGSGKTTVLRLIQRLIEPDRGVVQVEGRDVRELDPIRLRRSIGYVIQEVGLFPHMTVFENVELVPRLLGHSRAARRTRAAEVLRGVGLDPEEVGARSPGELSGGQRQRVGIARAIAAEPAIVLMDEPFGALDPMTREALQREFRALHERHGWTVVLVTHDMAEALLLADRIAVVRDGRVSAIGRPEALLASTDLHVRRLFETPTRQAHAIAALERAAAARDGDP